MIVAVGVVALTVQRIKLMNAYSAIARVQTDGTRIVYASTSGNAEEYKLSQEIVHRDGYGVSISSPAAPLVRRLAELVGIKLRNDDSVVYAGPVQSATGATQVVIVTRPMIPREDESCAQPFQTYVISPVTIFGGGSVSEFYRSPKQASGMPLAADPDFTIYEGTRDPRSPSSIQVRYAIGRATGEIQVEVSQPNGVVVQFINGPGSSDRSVLQLN
jgi:hypothetical protein